MYILGVNAYHGDSSACLLKDGVLVAAVEEERFTRIKHWAGFPVESIKYCLASQNININDISDLAINQNPKANLLKKIKFSMLNKISIDFIKSRLKNRKQRSSLPEEIKKHWNVNFSGQFHQVEHHYTHLSSAFHVSNFREAVVISVDGFGDFSSAAWGVGSNTNINIDGRVFFPHSLGVFYQALTQWLGFTNYGDEYKVMGLASYGEPKYINKLSNVLKIEKNGIFKLGLKYFSHHNSDINFNWSDGVPTIGRLFSNQLIDLLGPQRKPNEDLSQYHKDIARSVQTMYESALFSILNKLHKKYKIDNLCIAGGCAMNSVANGKIYDSTSFKKIYVQSAAGDAGGAIGAAYSVWHKKYSNTRSFHMFHSYWGPKFNSSEIENAIKILEKSPDYKDFEIKSFKNFEDISKLVARFIADGLVVGWFQGAMEWGPRALGNRSILGDPRRANMKDILNLKIKRRESFRPFAPSVLESEFKNWFKGNDKVPFMMQVYKIKKELRKKIPAVTHVDGSGRLQTVNAKSNKNYHSLISAFFKITGIPMILNTSFNENEPIVCNPNEAVDCFVRTKMDVLVLNNWVIKRT